MQEKWDELVVHVDAVHIIARSGDAPFSVIYSLPLGARDAGASLVRISERYDAATDVFTSQAEPRAPAAPAPALLKRVQLPAGQGTELTDVIAALNSARLAQTHSADCHALLDTCDATGSERRQQLAVEAGVQADAGDAAMQRALQELQESDLHYHQSLALRACCGRGASAFPYLLHVLEHTQSTDLRSLAVRALASRLQKDWRAEAWTAFCALLMQQPHALIVNALRALLRPEHVHNEV